MFFALVLSYKPYNMALGISYSMIHTKRATGIQFETLLITSRGDQHDLPNFFHDIVLIISRIGLERVLEERKKVSSYTSARILHSTGT